MGKAPFSDKEITEIGRRLSAGINLELQASIADLTEENALLRLVILAKFVKLAPGAGDIIVIDCHEMPADVTNQISRHIAELHPHNMVVLSRDGFDVDVLEDTRILDAWHRKRGEVN